MGKAKKRPNGDVSLSQRFSSGLKRRQRLDLHIFAHALDAGATAYAALLDSAVGRPAVDALGTMRVDEHGSGLEPPRELGGSGDVAAPNRAAEPVHRVVGAHDRVVDIAIGRDRHGRTELL